MRSPYDGANTLQKPAPGECSLYHQGQLEGPDGLDEVVGRTHAQSRDGAVHRGVCREQDEVRARMLTTQAPEEVEAREPRHL